RGALGAQPGHHRGAAGAHREPGAGPAPGFCQRDQQHFRELPQRLGPANRWLHVGRRASHSPLPGGRADAVPVRGPFWTGLRRRRAGQGGALALGRAIRGRAAGRPGRSRAAGVFLQTKVLLPPRSNHARKARARWEPLSVSTGARRPMTVEEALAVSAVRESESPRLDGDPGLGEETRRAMRVANVEGVLALASDNFAGPYVSLYALSLGASNTQIGLVNALPALLTNVLQIPFAILSDRLQRRKAFWVIGGGGMRVSWLPIALIPYFAVSPGAAVLAYIALLALRSVFAAASMPAWTSLMADMTPRSIRGAYFSNRNILINLSAFTATLASGA